MKKEKKREKKCSKRIIAVLIVLIAAAAGVFAVCLGFIGGTDNVRFEKVGEKELPNEITADIIPEYKTLERALACMVDDNVYVIVTRGEKPTSGFGVSVNKISSEEKDGRTNLIVYAVFDDPQKETAISHIITYPVQVVKTDLQKLPDSIELRIQY
ncbi:MAG: protease complex subunit PrcB family protein [Bacillota bacterium]|nr:protease complex subunit PrcB family protein [Bacillota bacterium]